LKEKSQGAELGDNSNCPIWRRLTAGIAIYALILQGIFAGFVGAYPTFAPGHEICLSGGHDGAIAPSELPGQHPDQIHCPLCVVGEPPIVAPTRAPIPGFAFTDARKPAWQADDQSEATSLRTSGHRSRAPPIVA
jgi:hypothetical protein